MLLVQAAHLECGDDAQRPVVAAAVAVRVAVRPDPEGRLAERPVARDERADRILGDGEAERLELGREVVERPPVLRRVRVAADRLARRRESGPGERLDLAPDPGGAPLAIDLDHDATLLACPVRDSCCMESWRNRKTLILGRSDMIGLLAPAEYVDCVEHAFRMHGLGRVYMEPKGHIVLDRYKGEWEVMPSWIEEPEAAACKWVSIREDNARFDLPAVFSILIYTHPETGFPLAICDGSYHTLMRTGASAAVSAKWLARPDSKVLAILGTGASARARSRRATRSSPGTRCGSGAARRSRSTASSPSRRRAIPTSCSTARRTCATPSRAPT